jgi:hypothetical protein
MGRNKPIFREVKTIYAKTIKDNNVTLEFFCLVGFCFKSEYVAKKKNKSRILNIPDLKLLGSNDIIFSGKKQEIMLERYLYL